MPRPAPRAEERDTPGGRTPHESGTVVPIEGVEHELADRHGPNRPPRPTEGIIVMSSTRTVRIVAALIAVFALTLTGCAAGGAGTGVPSSAQSAEGGPLGFQSTTVDGAPFDATALAGTPTVLWFWAPY